MTKKYTVKDILSLWRNWKGMHNKNMNTPEWRRCVALLSVCFEAVDEEVGREKVVRITRKGGFMDIPLGVNSMQALVAFAKTTKTTFLHGAKAENENK